MLIEPTICRLHRTCVRRQQRNRRHGGYKQGDDGKRRKNMSTFHAPRMKQLIVSPKPAGLQIDDRAQPQGFSYLDRYRPHD